MSFNAPRHAASPETGSGLFDLRDEVAVVVGGTGTLGGAMAEALARSGAKVGVMGRNEDRGQRQVQRITDAGGCAVFHAVDALESSSLRRANEAIRGEFGPVSVLVNAAGGNRPDATLSPGDSICRIPEGAWRGVFDLNLIAGALLPALEFGEQMLAMRRGSIIHIASMAGMNPISRVAAYSAAKAAVINLSKYLAVEWATRGVRVNSISPGFFPAEQNKRLLHKEDGTLTERGQSIIDHTPMARFGEASELSGALIWLASSRASSFVTGQNIVVDGGFSIATI